MRRRLSIEAALHWCYGEEMLKLGEDWGGGGRYAPGFSPSALAGYSGTTFYLSDPIPASHSEPHPDARTINDVVQGLASVALDASIVASELAPECAGMIQPGDPLLANLTVNVAALILMHAKMGTRPGWEVTWSVGAKIRDNGVPLIVGERVPHRAVYSTGSHCPLDIHPDPREVVSDRAEYHCWRETLVRLAGVLADAKLFYIEVAPPVAPERPWLDAPAAQAKVLRDLTKDWTPKTVRKRPMRGRISA